MSQTTSGVTLHTTDPSPAFLRVRTRSWGSAPKQEGDAKGSDLRPLTGIILLFGSSEQQQKKTNIHYVNDQILFEIHHRRRQHSQAEISGGVKNVQRTKVKQETVRGGKIHKTALMRGGRRWRKERRAWKKRLSEKAGVFN